VGRAFSEQGLDVLEMHVKVSDWSDLYWRSNWVATCGDYGAAWKYAIAS